MASSGIRTQIALVDNMSGVLSHIITALNSATTCMYNLNEAVGGGLDTGAIDNFRNSVGEVEDSVRRLNAQLRDTGNASGEGFNGLTKGALTAANAMGNIISDIGSRAIDEVRNIISASEEAYKTKETTEKQLIATLNNTSDNAQASYDAIEQKAIALQANGNYGKTALMSAGAEFATYFSDDEAIAQMMDTLTNYATGMSSGADLDAKSLTDYATNIAKLTVGSYQAMSDKGFTVTDVQKKIIEGTASEAEAIAELGDEAIGKSKEVQAAMAIDNIITESWGNLYENMNKGLPMVTVNTGNGKEEIMSLNNAWVALQQQFGGTMNQAMNTFNSALADNFGTIQTICNALGTAIGNIVYYMGILVDGALSFANVIITNWSAIEPIAVGIGAGLAYVASVIAIVKVATLAWNAVQAIMNATLWACPVTWIVAAIAAVIAIIIGVCQWIVNTTNLASSAFGVITGGLNVVKQFCINVFESIGAVFYNVYAGIVNCIKDIQSNFWGLLATAVEVVAGIAEKLNLLPFVNIDTTGLNNAAEDFRAKQEALQDSKLEYKDVGASFKSNWASDAFKSGAEWGDNLVSNLGAKFDTLSSGFDNSKMGTNTDQLVGLTSSINDSVSTSTDEMEYLKDIAEQEVINRFTTAEIKFDMGGVSQNISKDTDADGVIDYLVKGINQGISEVAEGVYS